MSQNPVWMNWESYNHSMKYGLDVFYTLQWVFMIAEKLKTRAMHVSHPGATEWAFRPSARSQRASEGKTVTWRLGLGIYSSLCLAWRM